MISNFKQELINLGLDVVDYGLQWAKPLSISKYSIEKLMWHADLWQGGTALQIHDDHISDKGYSGFAYNFRIKTNGQLELGRPVGMVTAHCYQQSMNHKSIGIVLEGVWTDYLGKPISTLTQEQMYTAIKLAHFLMQKLNLDFEANRPHREFATYKDCPGRYFPWEGFLEALYSGAPIERRGSMKSINPKKILNLQDVANIAMELPAKAGFPDRLSRLQYDLGSCVGASSAQAMSEIVGFPVSILWIWANCKLIDGIPDLEGTTPDALWYVLTELGVIPESWLVYSDEYDQFNLPTLTDEMYIEAKKHVIKGVTPLKNSKDIKIALANEMPVIFGAMVSADFRYDEDGYIDGFHGIMVGAHEMYIGAYDDNQAFIFETGESDKGFLKVEQTWMNGDEIWGDDGNGYIAYEAFDDIVIVLPGQPGFQMWDHAMGLIPTDKQREEMDARKRTVEFYIDHCGYYINGERFNTDVPSQINDSRTFLPIRACADALGKDVIWDRETREVIVSDIFGEIKMKIGSKEIKFKAIGQRQWLTSKTKMDVAPFIVKGRTMVPVRFVAQMLGVRDIKWDGLERRVIIEM